ncbi:MAG: porin [Planctomycetota bacterium]
MSIQRTTCSRTTRPAAWVSLWCALCGVLALPGAALADDPSASAGHGRRFYLMHPETGSGAIETQRFKLELRGEVQFRAAAVFGADGPFSDDPVTGFETGRVRLGVSGYVLSDKLTFSGLTSFSRSTGRLGLLDAYARYKLADGVKIRFGQFLPPYDREFSRTFAVNTQGIDRSLVSTQFRLNRSQGISAEFEGDRMRAFFTVSDGRNGLNTAFPSERDAEIALTSRFEWRAGEAPWSQFVTQAAFRGDTPGALFGLAGHWQQEGADLAPTSGTGMPTTNLFLYSADAGVEMDGWNAVAMFSGRVIDGGDQTLHDTALVLQAGAFVSERAELFARYEHLFFDSDRGGESDDFDAVTLGANWYLIPGSQAFRVTGEARWFPEAADESAAVIPAPVATVELLPDRSGGQFAIIGQVQMLF